MGGPFNGGPFGGPTASSTPAVQTLVDGANVAWNVGNGSFAKLTLGGNRTLSNPTGTLVAGQEYVLVVTQDATGQRTLSFGTTFEDASQIYRSPNAVTVLRWVYDGSKLRRVGEPLHTRIMAYANNTADTNQAAGEVEFLGTSARRITVSLRGATEYRATADVRTIGHTTAAIGWQYTLDGGVSWTWLDGTAVGSGSASGHAPLSATGSAAGAWTAIASAAKVDTVTLRPVAFGGNGVADPVYSFGLEWR